MFVRDCMSSNPIYISAATPIMEALNTMKKHKIRQLPVMDKGSLVGLVTERELLTVSPSPATTLSVYEMNFLLSKMVVSEVMTKNPMSVEPDCIIEEAALIMRDNKIGSLLVEENNELVGIITQTDVFDALIKTFGLRKAGTRVVLEVKDKIGALAEILEVVKEMSLNVIGIATLDKPDQRVQVMLRLSTIESDPFVEKIKGLGYQVIAVK